MAVAMRLAAAASVLWAALAVFGGSVVNTASNSVPTFKASNNTRGITANELKPSQCDGLNLTSYSVFGGAGDFEGGSGNELLLGDGSSQKIRGRDGNDCVVGGTNTQELRGDNGTDVCIGYSGTTFQGDCETVVHK